MRCLRLVTVVLALGACGAPPPVSEVPSIVIPECDDTAMCLLGFEIEGDFWSAGCSWLRPESVTEEVIAVGDSAMFVDQVRTIVDLDPMLMAAAHMTGSDCGPIPTGSSGWFAAFGPANTGQDEETAARMARAICDHLDTSAIDLCEEGGRIQWIQGDAYKFAYFPEYQEEVEEQLGRGSGPEWRLDPTEVAMRHWIREQGLCIDDSSHDFSPENYPRCRVGLNPAVVDGDIATVSMVLQWGEAIGTENELAYSTYSQQVTLESTGLAWWVTGFIEDPPTAHGTTDEARQQSDDLWADCCTIVLSDIERGIQPVVTG